MRLILSIVSMAVVLALPVVPASAAVKMEEGNWELRMETSIEGGGAKLPGGLGGKIPGGAPAMPATVINKCLTQKDLVPGTAGKDEKKCKVTNVKVAGNTVTWSVDCAMDDGSKMTGSGEVTYNGASMNGTVKSTMTPKGGKPMASTMKMSGKKTGPCAK